MLKMVLVWALAAFFLFQGVWVLVKSKWNMGSFMIWALAAVFTAYALFFQQLNVWMASGLGLAVKILFLSGLAVLVGIMLFLGFAAGKNTLQGDEKAILVLGAGLHRTQVSDILWRRLKAAKAAYEKNTGALLVVCGGQGRGEEIPEALAMRRWLVENGVPGSAVLIEDKSTSTETNLRYARQLLEEKGIEARQPVAVVTNRFHCYRARRYAQQAGFQQVRSLPATMNRPTFLQNYLREAAALVDLWLFHRAKRETAAGEKAP